MMDKQGFYPELNAAPILIEGKRPHWNDFQPAVYNKKTNQWNAWVLENPDVDTETGTVWRKIISNDLKKWTVGEITIPKNTAGFGDAWTGQCFIDENNLLGYGAGTWCFFLTMACPDASGNQNQSVVLWTAPDGETAPTCQGISLANPWGSNAHFRDPSIREINGTVEMTITTGSGISIYQWYKGTWQKLQDMPAPYNTVECAQRFTMWSDDFNKNIEIVVFSGNVYDHMQNQNTTVSMFAQLTPCASGYCMTTMSSDVTKMFVDGGSDFYSFRLFYGLEDKCCPNNRKVYGMAWIGNWDYDANVPLEEWEGQLTPTFEVKLVAGEGGYPTLALNPLVPSWKRNFSTNAVTWVGKYSNIPTRQIPDVCEINMHMEVDGTKTFPTDFKVKLYGGGFVGAFLTISTDDKGVVTATVTRDDYGLRPFGDFSSWNYSPKRTLGSGIVSFDIRIIKDNSSIIWIINNQVSFTQMILFPADSQYFMVDIPDGYQAKGTASIGMNRFPEKTLSVPTDLDISGRFMDIRTPVITTYSGDTEDGEAVNHAIKQLAWVIGKDNSTKGMFGVIDNYGTGARSVEYNTSVLSDDYAKFKKTVITNIPADSNNDQVLQITRNPVDGTFKAVINKLGTDAVTMEKGLEDFKDRAITTFGGSPGNHRIKSITYNEQTGYEAVIASSASDTIPNNSGGASGNSGESGSGDNYTPIPFPTDKPITSTVLSSVSDNSTNSSGSHS